MIQCLERKFFQALNQHYFSRQETAICQNAAFILGRVLSKIFNLPLSQDGVSNQDCIEIAIGIYAPEELKDSFHQTFLRIHLAGEVLYIDPTLALHRSQQEKILIRRYSSESFWPELKREFGLEPYDANHRAYQGADILASQYRNPVDRERYVKTALKLLHGEQLSVTDKDDFSVTFSFKEWKRFNLIFQWIEKRALLPDLKAELRRIERELGPEKVALLHISQPSNQ
jgi:hypothetical protein